ncbi:telomere-protecting terminal protein Tpg [Streptomyces buecherae]|uniref:XRE family transcriptional regulator n=1 Tax=Streptomyces buecherae TaxID=2763006 RepID=A0A7H8NKC2_9ACTN|nr:XRE family transcriptional regulator [Streptomyces buecherae]QKW55024.1 XRE family transcriptional regulator [Streptomyces buecherae]
MEPIREGFAHAAQAAPTRPLPKTAPAQMRALVRALGGTRAAAGVLGVSQRTVERYVRAQIRRPRPDLAGRLAAELRRHWQPGLQRAALRRAARAGFTVETRATFGYRAPGGSTDEARRRLITQHIPPALAAPVIDAYLRGESEHQLQTRVADILGEQLALSSSSDVTCRRVWEAPRNPVG